MAKIIIEERIHEMAPTPLVAVKRVNEVRAYVKESIDAYLRNNDKVTLLTIRQLLEVSLRVREDVLHIFDEWLK